MFLPQSKLHHTFYENFRDNESASALFRRRSPPYISRQTVHALGIMLGGRAAHGRHTCTQRPFRFWQLHRGITTMRHGRHNCFRSCATCAASARIRRPEWQLQASLSWTPSRRLSYACDGWSPWKPWRSCANRDASSAGGHPAPRGPARIAHVRTCPAAPSRPAHLL